MLTVTLGGYFAFALVGYLCYRFFLYVYKWLIKRWPDIADELRKNLKIK